MQLKTYDETDIRGQPPLCLTGEATDSYNFLFMEDVAGDNYELFEARDNDDVAFRLEEAGVITSADRDAPESSILYVYFKQKKDALAFIKRLNAYLQEKARKLEDAKAY